MTFPLHDWQFWVATLAAAGALAWMVWTVWPARRKRTQARRATLTVEGKTPRK